MKVLKTKYLVNIVLRSIIIVYLNLFNIAVVTQISLRKSIVTHAVG